MAYIPYPVKLNSAHAGRADRVPSAASTPAGRSHPPRLSGLITLGAAVAGLLGLPLLQVAAGPLDLFLLVAVAGSPALVVAAE